MKLSKTLNVAFVLALLVNTPNTWAGDNDNKREAKRNNVSLFYGEVAGESGVEGHLGVCDGSAPAPFLPDRLVVRSTYQRLAGVCDDQGKRPCSGRLIRVLERCTHDDQPVFAIGGATFPTGPANVSYIKARVRICYDESGSGYCDNVDEVARGWVVSQVSGNFYINPNASVPVDFTSTAFDEEKITHSKQFKIDGGHARVPRGNHRGSSSARVSLTCIINNNCPSIGSLVKHH